MVKRLPMVAEVERAVTGRVDLRFQNVKTLARLAADPDGVDGFARLQGLTGAAASPPAPHVPSFAEAVPVTPSRLRTAMAGALEQLRVEVPRGRIVLTLGHATKRCGAMSGQFDWTVWADLDGVRLVDARLGLE